MEQQSQSAPIPRANGDKPSLLTRAIQYWETGQYREAAAWLNEWITTHPHDADALALLSHVLLLDEKIDEALNLVYRAQAIAPKLPPVQRALARILLKKRRVEQAFTAAQFAYQGAPEDPENWLVLAAVLSAKRRDNEAITLLDQTLNVRPTYAEAYANRAVIRMRAKDVSGALRDAEQAFAIKPHLPQLLALIATLRYQTGDLTGAIAALERVHAQEPDNVRYMVDLGELLRKSKQVNEALTILKEAVDQAPENADAWTNFGIALQESGRVGEAKAAYNKALAISPTSAEIANSLGALAADEEDWKEALNYFERALGLKPEDASILCNRAAALERRERVKEAEESCRKALELEPNLVSALELLGQIERDFGNFDKAQQLFGKALEIQPGHPTVWAQLTSLRKMTLNDRQWLETAERITKTPQTTTKEKVRMLYAMGKYCDDVKDYTKAFVFIKQANDSKKSLVRRYEREYQTELVDRIICGYQKSALIKRHDGANESMRPLFIVGMPRSGTSLLEQIIASHPSAVGAGELLFWSDVIERLGLRVLNPAFTSELVTALATECLGNLDYYSREALRVVDKMPGNCFWLGLIHIVFPNARILHSKRNPVDTCLSMYFQNFRDDAHAYSYDLEDLAHYYREYHRLMVHWRNVFPPKAMLDVPYEAVVDDAVGWSRRIIEFIGLDWDESCLNFHKTERRVGTASNWQVRQPLFKTSKERWHNYEQFVEPLLPLLELHDTNGV